MRISRNFRKKGFTVLLVLCLQYGLSAQSVLRFSWWGPDTRNEATLKAIDLFEARNPGVKIRGEYMGFDGYVDNLTKQFSASHEPDIMQVNWAWVSTIFSKDGTNFYDLYRLRNILSLDEFEGAEASGIVNGKLNAVPISHTMRAFLWQKRTFEKAGVPIPVTWDDLFKAGSAMEKKAGHDYYPVMGNYYDRILLSLSWIQQKTGKSLIGASTGKVDLSKSEIIQCLRFFKHFKDAHVTSPTPPAVEQWTQGFLPEWMSGKWAGCYKWETETPLYLEPLKNTAVEPGLPLTMPGGKSLGAYCRPAFMYAVSKKSQYPETAAKFIRFLLTDADAVRIQGTTRGIPATRTGYTLLMKDKKISAVQLKIRSYIQKNKPPLPSPWFEHVRIQDHIRGVFLDYESGKTDEEAAAHRLLEDTNEILRCIQ